MSSETTNWEALARYLAGESPAEEQAAVRQWLAEHPADAKMLGALDDALGRVTLGPDATKGIDVEAALAKVKSTRQVGPSLRSGQAGSHSSLALLRAGSGRRVLELRPRRTNWVPIAAAAGIVFVAGLWLARPSDESTPTLTKIAARTLSTPVGGRDSLVLPDGSQVMLGPGSELTMVEGYGLTERRVTLRGEALFTVLHDDTKPFIVAANGAEIRDVGTAFVVHSDGGGVRVAVTEGVVELTAARQSPTTLNAGDAASVTPAGEVAAQRGVGAGDDLAWTKGRLVFRDAPLEEVAEDLQRWYGVTLVIRDPALRRRPFAGSFAGDSIGSVLEVLSRALGATVERRGDTAFVRASR